MTGPLARRNVELTNRVTVAEDNVRHFIYVDEPRSGAFLGVYLW